MNTPRRRSRKKVTLDNDDLEEIVYTEEEAEFLGLENDAKDKEEDDEDDDLFSKNEDDEDEDEEEVAPVKKTYSKTTDKEKYYVNPQEFDDEIVKYYDSGTMSDNLAQMVSKIAHKLSYAPNFINYTYREEMVGDGIIRMFKALTTKKYDREKGTNPFSYFTRIAFNAFRNRIKKEKHLRETHEKYQNELLLFSGNHNAIVKNNQLKISKKRDLY
jgi:hypothetical protein